MIGEVNSVNKLTLVQFVDKAVGVHGNSYDYSKAVYVTSHTKLIIQCKKHGDFTQRPNDHLQGNGCPQCKYEKIASMKRHNVDTFIKKAKEVHGNVYDYKDVVYVNAVTKVKITCSLHGTFTQTPDKHISGRTACPQCSYVISVGERKISMWLEHHGIQYEREKRFDGLIGTTPNSRLRYDFFLPTLGVLLEYDGEQHFSPVRVKGKLSVQQSIDKYERCKINDVKKTQYAERNGYDLLRIRYDQDIESILTPLLHY